jgi:hypothetical protein
MSKSSMTSVKESGQGSHHLPHLANGDARAEQAYEMQFLLVRQDDNLVVVGAIALAPGAEPLHNVEFTFLEEVARGIYSAGDVCTILTGAPLPSSLSRTVRQSRK